MSRAALRRRTGAVIPPVTSTYDNLVLADNPVAYWSLDASNTDLTGNGHTLTRFGAPGSSSFMNGDDCTVLDGLTQYFSTPDAPDLSVVNTGILCIETWIRVDVLDFPDEETATAPYVYFAGKKGPSQAEWQCRMYSRRAAVDWPATYGIQPRPNRISGYINNLAATPPATTNLGAGSYFQDDLTAMVGGWIHYFFRMDSVNTSSLYPMGYTDIYRDGQFRRRDGFHTYNIVPADGTAPVRIGTSDDTSHFLGGMAKFAIYGHNLTSAQIMAHYRNIVPWPPGTGGIVEEIGTATAATTGRKLEVIVGQNGVPAGSTIVIKSANSYTAGNPVVQDSKSNTYVARTSQANAALTWRHNILTGAIMDALEPNDIIRLTTSADTAERVMLVERADNIVTNVDPVDSSDTGSGNSITPGSNAIITNSQADVVVIGMNTIPGSLADTYTEDTTQPWIPRTRVSSAGPLGLVINSVDQAVNTIVSNRKYSPVNEPARSWTAFITALKSGTPVIVPPTLGSASYVETLGSNEDAASSTTLVLTVQGEGVSVGNTVVGDLCATWTAANPVVTDSQGNVYVIDRASSDGATVRTCKFRSQVAVQLNTGDTITITWSAAVTNRAAWAGHVSGLLVPATVDVVNSSSGTSASPSITATTLNADDFLLASIVALRPKTDTFGRDITWTPLPVVGTSTGALPMTILPAYRPVGVAGAYTKADTLDTAAAYWLGTFVSYRAS